ncbi:MAG TPA: serine hydrolase domain-containing protein [Caulobacteraceae bacterium]|jgi:CubicO group peptidase (beta-lactamase class C family)|nr:serine hydrolase domain-containing protein [Caulobacteraceae bacterium]
MIDEATTIEPSDLLLIEALKTLIPLSMRSTGEPGVSIALARRGELIWRAAFGSADLAQSRPLGLDDVVKGGSMTKPYTATAVMQLVEQGILQLDERADQHLPFKVENPLGEQPVTVRDLLLHQSGLAAGDAGESQAQPPRPLAQALEAAYLRAFQRAYEETRTPTWSAKVGETWQYSNLGTATLGLIVERANPKGLSLSDYVQAEIMDPLGMRFAQLPQAHDAVHVRPEVWSRLTSGYSRLGGVYLPTPVVQIEGYPAGSVLLTPGDQLRLLLAFLKDGEHGGARILRAESVQQMLTPHRDGAGPGVQQGFIWWLRDVGQITEQFEHGGAYMFGWVNTGVAWRRLDAAMVVSANAWPLPGGATTRDLLQAFVGDWLVQEAKAGGAPPAGDWNWRAGYAMGLILADAYYGAIGVRTRLTASEARAMAEAAMFESRAPGGGAGWDPEGLVAAFEDLRDVPMTAEGIGAFRGGGAMRVSQPDLAILHRALGGGGDPSQFRFLSPKS